MERLGLAGEAPLNRNQGVSSSGRLLPSGLSWGSPGSAQHLSQARWVSEKKGRQSVA